MLELPGMQIHAHQLAVAGNGDDDSDLPLAAGPIVLGKDPETGLDVSLRKGSYGPYIQLGEAIPADSDKQKAVSRSGRPYPKAWRQPTSRLKLHFVFSRCHAKSARIPRPLR